MAEYASRATIRIGAVEYPISISDVFIRTVPRLDGAPPFVTDISGKRRLNYSSCEFYLDGDIVFPEHGYQWDEWVALAQAILAHTTSSEDQIDFCMAVPYDSNLEIADIVIVIDDDLMNHVFSGNIRLRPSSLKFKSVNPTTALPAWFVS